MGQHEQLTSISSSSQKHLQKKRMPKKTLLQTPGTYPQENSSQALFYFRKSLSCFCSLGYVLRGSGVLFFFVREFSEFFNFPSFSPPLKTAGARNNETPMPCLCCASSYPRKLSQWDVFESEPCSLSFRSLLAMKPVVVLFRLVKEVEAEEELGDGHLYAILLSTIFIMILNL